MRKFLVLIWIIAIVTTLVLTNNFKTKENPSENLETTTEIENEQIVEPTPEPEVIPAAPKTEAKLLIVGDVALLPPVDTMVKEHPEVNPFDNVMWRFHEYDYVVADQEGTIDGESVGVPNPGKAFTFSTPKESVGVYKEAGIDSFYYANNHAKDYGPQSVTHTMELLRAEGIDVFGAGNNLAEAYTPLIKEINGNTISFLAFNCAEYAYNTATETEAGVAPFVEPKVRAAIADAKSKSQYLIVMSHCGDEHVTTPNELQITWANIYTSAGADFVVGGHPHVRQPEAVVNGKPVVYSLGNFMFPGQAWDPEAQIGWALEIIIENGQLKSHKLIESEMSEYGIPTWRE